MLTSKSSIFLGLLVRIGFFASPALVKWLVARPEISTPQSSWTRLQEGIALYEHNISLYDGDSYHDTPLMLQLFYNVKQLSPLLFPLIFMLADAVAGWHLYLFSKLYIRKQISKYQENKHSYSEDSMKILVKKDRIHWVPDLVCMLYMLNPFIITTCVAKSTVVVNNLYLSLLLYHAAKGNALQMTLCLALSTYQTLYPVQLLVPMVLIYHQVTENSLSKSAIKLTLLSGLWILFLFSTSYSVIGNPSMATFKFILSVPDLTPNVGVFWYFFTEVFDHFHTFFLSVFQLNIFIFTVPLTIKLRSRPVFLMFLLCYIIAIFKSYPCVADAGFCLCLLPLWSYTFRYLRLPLITSIMLLVSSILCPIMWHLWIQAGSANANFYFATTLAYCTSHVLIMTDILVAYVKYDFHLHEGIEPKLPNSNKVALIRLLN